MLSDLYRALLMARRGRKKNELRTKASCSTSYPGLYFEGGLRP